MLPEPGHTVADAFRIECRLGGGQTSAVYGATVEATGKRYALRCWLTQNAEASAAAAQQFIHKAQTHGLFQHPHIVEVFAISQLEGTHFAVTEWLEGTTLERYLQRHGSLALPQALSLLLPCMDAVALAHDAGLVHGDLRPANVFLCRPTPFRGMRARLLNFGLVHEALRATSGVFHTRGRPSVASWFQTSERDRQQYISPEELQGRALNARTDVYAFGVLLYRALSGVSPFNAATAEELPLAIVGAVRVPLEQRASHLSPSVCAVVERAMSVDQADRYADMRELAQALALAVSRAPWLQSRRALQLWSALQTRIQRWVDAMGGAADQLSTRSRTQLAMLFGGMVVVSTVAGLVVWSIALHMTEPKPSDPATLAPRPTELSDVAPVLSVEPAAMPAAADQALEAASSNVLVLEPVRDDTVLMAIPLPEGSAANDAAPAAPRDRGPRSSLRPARSAPVRAPDPRSETAAVSGNGMRTGSTSAARPRDRTSGAAQGTSATPLASTPLDGLQLQD